MMPAWEFQQDEEQKAEDIVALGAITGQKRDHYEDRRRSGRKQNMRPARKVRLINVDG